MASGFINAWQIEGEKVEVVTDLFFLGSEITAECDSSHVIRRQLLLDRKAMTNLDSVLKSKDIILPTKILIVKVMVCPLVMYGCESRTIKKAERQRIEAFKLWCWRRFLKVLWTARRSNQSILRETNLEYSLEGLMLKLNLQYLPFDANRLGKVLYARKDQGQKRASEDDMAGQHHQCNEDELGQTLRGGEGQGGLACHSLWGCKESDMTG